MSIPQEFQINHPLTTFIIPSTKKPVRFRPFLCKEEKILLSAKNTPEEIINVIKQIITNCAIDNDIKSNSLALYDLEYLYIKLVSISISNIKHARYRDHEDNKIYDFDIDLANVDIIHNPEHSNKIKLSDNAGILLKPPVGNIPKEIWSIDPKDTKSQVTALFSLFKSCINQVYKNEKMLDFSEQSEEDKDQFVDKLPITAFEQFRTFIRTLPKLYYKIEYKNSKEHSRTIVLETLEDFFI